MNMQDLAKFYCDKQYCIICNDKLRLDRSVINSAELIKVYCGNFKNTKDGMHAYYHFYIDRYDLFQVHSSKYIFRVEKNVLSVYNPETLIGLDLSVLSFKIDISSLIFNNLSELKSFTDKIEDCVHLA